MSHALIARSPDLQRLLDEGYEVSIRSGHLVIDSVPYVTPAREVALAALVSDLTLDGDRTGKPKTHVIMFTGEHAPCHASGRQIEAIYHGPINTPIQDELVAKHQFSNKPAGGYTDYFHKVDTYATIISAPAASIRPDATPKTFRPSEAHEECPFHYLDTASSRARITSVSSKLEDHRLGIVGLGGGGAYVLDFVAKTPVAQIHLFDFDHFHTHNAFRAPGAPSLETLRQGLTKTAYLHAVYSRMHRHIIPHELKLDGSNVSDLGGLDFVFLCIDDGAAKAPIVDFLEGRGIAFIDIGMGVNIDRDTLGGTLRVTTSTPGMRDHLRKYVSMAVPAEDPDYSTNIQIAELNALNAAMAVIRWKKLLGFYRDLIGEHCSTYTINVNQLDSREHQCPE